VRTAPVVAVILCVLGAPLASDAQQPPRAPRVGFLWTSSPETTVEYVKAFRQGLREAGYTEGRNIVIEHRWAAEAIPRLDGLATGLVGTGVSIIGPREARRPKRRRKPPGRFPSSSRRAVIRWA